MKRIIIVMLFCFCLFFYGVALAEQQLAILKYNDIEKGMSYNDVLTILRDKGFAFEEKEFETSKSIIIRNDHYKIGIGIKDDKVSALFFTKLGEKTSNLDLFDKGWSFKIDDIISLLEEENAEYDYNPENMYYSDRNGIKIWLEYPIPVQPLNFNGYMDGIPVRYYLTFDQDGSLLKNVIRDIHTGDENIESNYLVILSYMVEHAGIPEGIKTEDEKTFSIEDGGAILSDSCHWKYHDSWYEMIIETMIEQASEDDEPFKGDFYKSVSLIVTPYVE